METCHSGPGFRSPIDAMKAPREKIIYIPCITTDDSKCDYLSTVDIDPSSPTYCQVIHRSFVTHPEDEIHHTGWNACSSCHENTSKKRNRLLCPSMVGSRVYVFNMDDPRKPTLETTVEPKNMLGLRAPHTTHCLPNDVIISFMGDINGNAHCGFLLLDPQTFEVKGTWGNGILPKYNYDFWYQPRQNVMASSAFGAPKYYEKGFNPADVEEHYGNEISFWDFKEQKLLQTIDMAADGGIIPLELRFLHNPNATEGFVGCVLSSNVFRFYKTKNGDWATEKVIQIPNKIVENWMLPEMPSLIVDVIISMDDRFLYFSNWLHGDIRQYDIKDTRHPKLVGQIFLGGNICSDRKIKVIKDEELTEQPKPRYIKGKRIEAGPQMLQLSLDGKRLYTTTSLFKVWDRQFYPELPKSGSVMMQIDCDTDKGGLKLNENFLVDFGKEPYGPVLAHEMRYPGGDCTSDIWM